MKSQHKSAWHHRPVVGLLALTAGLLGQWFRHAIFPLAETAFGPYYYASLLALGFAGAALVWRGLRQAEIPGTWKGYLGGLFIWVGWFEFGFHYFSDKFSVPSYAASARLVSGPDLNLVMASFPAFCGIFLLYGLFNRQTRCNLMRWIHRNFHLDPGSPSPGETRSFARITALETLFVVWFCYAVWLFITYFGASMRILMVAYVAWALWFFYLVFRLVRIPQAGYAFRYGIPVGIIGWVLVATPSHMGLFPVIWLKPFEYPVSTLVASVVFVATVAVFATSGGQPEGPSASESGILEQDNGRPS
ncbi:MAG: hypothetical protein J0M16_00095 [Gammaproteobacteria bacterium]|nr:hypothetical protein [Gammaproteobacteria bacterium]